MKKSLRPDWLSALNKWVRSRIKLQRLARQYTLNGISSNPLRPYKKSNTLFVLGSGASINELRQTDWEEIRNSDSIGFNYWVLHDFVPNVYMFEPHAPLEATNWLFHNFKLRGSCYDDIPIILKDGERYRRSELVALLGEMPPAIRSKVILSWDWETKGDDPAAFSRVLKTLNTIGVLTDPIYPALRKRASVSLMTILAMRAGYKKIVLCGIDLSNADYFYASRRSDLEAQGFIVPPPPRPSNQPHKTEDPTYGNLTASTVLLQINAIALKPRSIELYVALRASKLYPALPAYFQH